MAMEDFTANFTHIDICNVYPHFLDSGNDCIWAMSEHNGSWIKGTSAGGSLKEGTIEESSSACSLEGYFMSYVFLVFNLQPV